MTFLQSDYLKTTVHKGFSIGKLENQDWYPVLKKSDKILKELRLETQLGSGTLLGAVREKEQYIKHDTDIDWDVIVREGLPDYQKIVNEFEMKGLMLIRTQLYDSKRYMQIAFQDKNTNVIVDLCFFYNIWDDNFYNVYEHGIFIRPKWSVNYTDTLRIKDSVHCIPKDIDKYLTGRYGDWKTPKVYKESGEKDAAKFLILL